MIGAFAVLLAGAVVMGPPAHAATDAAPTGLAATLLDDGSPQLTWDRVDGATSYKVEVASSPAFATSDIITAKTGLTSPVWVPERTLSTASGRDVFWRVSVGAEPSDASSLTLAPLRVPALVAPDDAATVTYPAAVAFSWTPVPGAIGYTLQYSSDAFSSAPGTTTTIDGITTTAYTPNVALPRTAADGSRITWQWRVRANFYTATATGEAGAFSAPRGFQVAWPTSLSAPTLMSPQDDVTTAFSDLQFRWTPVSGASRYQFALGTDKTSDGTSILSPTVVDVVGTVYVPTTTMLDANYFWQVRAYDSDGNLGEPSAIFEVKKVWGNQTGSSFDVAGAEPTYPRALTGSTTYAGAQQTTLGDFELRWQPLPRATFYEVEVYPQNGDPVLTCRTASTSVTIIGYSAAGTGASSSLKGSGTCLWTSDKNKRIQVGGTYRWRVRGVDYPGSSTVSYQQSAYAPDPLFSEWSDPQQGDASRARYVTVVPSPVTAGDIVLDHDSLTAQTSSALIGQPAPVLAWTATSVPADHDVSGDGVVDDDDRVAVDGYEVRLFADAQRTNLITTVRTPSTRVRLDGVLQANTTSASYYADVRPFMENSNMSSSTGILYKADATADTFNWTRTTATLSLGPSPVSTLSDGTVLLSWDPQFTTGSLDGGSRGYRIVVTNASGTAVDSGAKIEYPWFVASYPATGKPLPDGSYQFKVQPLDANGDPGRETASVPFTVATPVPGGTAEVVNGTGATFSWTPTSSSRKYQVQYWAQSAPGTVTLVGNASAAPNDAADVRQTSLVASAQAKPAVGAVLSPGTYLWQVRSIDTSGNASAWSSARSFTVPTLTPSLVTEDGTAFVSQPKMLRWQSVPAASRYVMQVSTDPSFGSGTTSIETVATAAAIPGALVYGTRYYWRVRAVAEPYVSSPTAARAVLGESETRAFTAVTLPKTMTVGAVKAVGTRLAISWTVLSTDANAGDVPESVRYRVQYRKAGDEWDTALIHQNDSQLETSWTTPELEESTSYEVRVAAVNRAGQGAWSTAKTVKTAAPPTSAPSLAATPGKAALVLRFGTVSGAGTGGSAITGYRVTYARASSATWGSVEVPVGQKTYVLSGLAPLTAYDVEVAAVNAVGAGPVSSGTWTTLGDPGAPRSLKGKVTSGRVELTWAAPASDGGSPVTGYTVQRRQGSGPWQTVTSRTSSTSYTSSGLVNGTTYQFRVAAITKASSAGPWSAAIAVTPATPPSAPAKLTVKAKKKGKFALKWKKAAANGSRVTTYVVQYSTNGSKWKKAKALPGSKAKLTYKAKKGKKGKTLYFRVIAQNALGKSSPTSAVGAVKK